MEQPADSIPAGEQQGLSCPLCGYDLRAISNPRCPECGYAFTWEELRDPTRRLHDYLFEHHPHRPVWSFLRTVVGGLLPWRFWSRLHPTQPSYPRRIVLYWLIVVAMVFVPFMIAWSAVVIVQKTEMPKWRSSTMMYYTKNRAPVNWQDTPVEEMMDRWYPLFPSPRFFLLAIGDSGAVTWWLVITIVWPWATVASMLLLRQSMRRARINPAHVVRCSIYAGDAMIWGALLLCPISIMMLLAALRMQFGPFYGSIPYISMASSLAMLVLALVMVWRLAVAYRRYLRLPTPWLVAILLQVLVWLVMVFVLAGFYSFVGRGW